MKGSMEEILRFVEQNDAFSIISHVAPDGDTIGSGTALSRILRRLGVDTVILAGTTTPNCIRSSCYDALSLDYDVVVLSDCTSSVTNEVQRANLEDMARIGAKICTVDELSSLI